MTQFECIITSRQTRSWVDVDIAWYRGIEHQAHAHIERIDKELAEPPVIAYLEEVRADLEEFLRIDPPGTFALLIDQDHRHLRTGGITHEEVRRRKERLFLKARAAHTLSNQARQIQREIAADHVRYGTRFPTRWSEITAAQGLDGPRLLRIRCDADVRQLVRRLQVLRSRFWALEAAWASAKFTGTIPPVDDDETFEELTAAMVAARTSFVGTTGIQGVYGTSAALVKRHLDVRRTLIHVDELPRGQELAFRITESRFDRMAGQPFGGACEGTAVLPGLFSQQPDPTANPTVPPSRPSQGGAAPSTAWFVLPMGNDRVWITKAYVTPMRIGSTLQFERGRDVEVVAFCPVEMMDIGEEKAKALLSSMFRGDVTRGWYETQETATITIIGEAPDGWFARVKKQGRLNRLGTTSWLRKQPTGGAIHVLRDHGMEEDTAVGKPMGGFEFCGLHAHLVPTESLRASEGWLRVAELTTPEGVLESDAMMHELLERTRDHGRSGLPAGLIRIGRAAGHGESDRSGTLYRRPFGYPHVAVEPIGLWLRQHERARFDVAVGMNELRRRLNGLGHGLGLYHLNALVIAFRWKCRGEPCAVPSIGFAPAAAKFGESASVHEVPWLDEHGKHDHLGVTGVSEPLGKGDPLTRDTETAAFAVFMLDLLTQRPLTLSPGETWRSLPDVVSQNLDAFVDRNAATELATGVARGDWNLLESLIARTLVAWGDRLDSPGRALA